MVDEKFDSINLPESEFAFTKNSSREKIDTAKNTDARAKEKLLEQDIEDRKQNRKQRLDYADKIYKFIRMFTIFLGLIIITNNFELCNIKIINLSDPVLITLLSASFAKILGLFYFVMRYLFPNNQDY
jgi:hypothetical protein